MAHQLLLHSHRCSRFVQPRAVGMPKGMPADAPIPPESPVLTMVTVAESPFYIAMSRRDKPTKNITLIVCRLIVGQTPSIRGWLKLLLRRSSERQCGPCERVVAILSNNLPRAGLHRNYVGGVERRERNIALENIVKLAQALSVRTQDLFDTLP